MKLIDIDSISRLPLVFTFIYPICANCKLSNPPSRAITADMYSSSKAGLANERDDSDERQRCAMRYAMDMHDIDNAQRNNKPSLP